MTRNPSSSPQGRASSTVKKTGSTGTPTPCCSKVGLKRGPWTPEEDEVLADYIRKEGEGRWRTLPKRAGLLRCGKSCRLRWMNYLRPSVKRGQIAADEEDLILRLHRLLGNRWSLIAGRIPGRTDNEIKNYWNTHLSKKLISQGIDPRTHKPLIPPILPSPSTTTTTTTTPHNNNNHSSKDYLPIITNTSNHHNIILDQPNTPIPIPNNNNLIINGNQEGFDPKSTSTHMGEELDQFQPHAHHHIKGANNHNSAYDNLDIASNDVSTTGLIKSNIDNLLITSNNEDTHHYDDVNYCSDDIFSSFLNSLINEDAFASHHVQLEPPNNGNNHNNNIALLPCDDHHDYDNDPLISITTSSALDVAWDQSSPLVPATFSQKEDPNSKMVEDDHHNK